MSDPQAFADQRGYRPFDADNHYYEALDCVTRHLDPRHAARVFQWAQIDGRTYPVLGGEVFRGVKNATFDPVAPPVVVPPAVIVIGVAVAPVVALCHHWCGPPGAVKRMRCAPGASASS